MIQIALIGDWRDHIQSLTELLADSYLLLQAPFTALSDLQADWLLVKLTDSKDLVDLQTPDKPWLVWDQSNDPALPAKLYQLGALSVLPSTMDIASITAVLLRHIQQYKPPAAPAAGISQHRKYEAGSFILLEPDTVVFVEEGIIAQYLIYKDGNEVLLGLSRPGQAILPHPDDTCYIQLKAHTQASVSIQPLSLAVRSADFVDKLRSRIQLMEAWISMQSRPHLEQRIMGILSLLSEQFGSRTTDGVKLTIKLPQKLLASATGANRTSITRALSSLRNSGKLIVLKEGSESFFCLPAPEPSHHGLHAH